MNLKYSVQIVWSEDDAAYLAQIPELPGCMADGKTPEEAIKTVYEVAEEWIKSAQEMSRPVPSPLSVGDYSKMAIEFRSKVQEEVKRQVEDAVGRVLKELSHLTPMLTAGKDPADYWKDC